MKNLQYIAYDEIISLNELPLTAAAWDSASENTQICAFGPTSSKAVIELRKVTKSSLSQDGDASNGFSTTASSSIITSWDAPSPLADLPCDNVLSLQYLSDVGSVSLVLAGGDLVIVRENPLPGEEKIEIVGSVDVGISAASWSPDEELLAIVTRSNTLLYMTRDFESVSEVSLTSEDLKASKHVSVGWGKKETQFQGKRAKALRDPTMPETIDEGKTSPFEDGATTISWRGDGAFVAINSIVDNDRRAIRVFSREGALDGVSEPVDNLESALSWRPAGNLIASIQRYGSRIDVVFFERNGLRHGQFELRLSEDEMKSAASNISLSWNIDSTVLAVSFLDRVQLWTMGNYHYYLKQEISLPKALQAPCSVRWHPEKPLSILLEATDRLIVLEYSFSVSRGPVITPEDFGITAVIDGDRLKLTPLRLTGIPPPMSLVELGVGENIVDCAISPYRQRIAVLTHKAVYYYNWDKILQMPKSQPSLMSRLNFTDVEHCHNRQIMFVNDESFVVLRHNETTGSYIQCLEVDAEGQIKFHDRSISQKGSNSYLFTGPGQALIWWYDGDLRYLDHHFQTYVPHAAHGNEATLHASVFGYNLPVEGPHEPNGSGVDQNERQVVVSLTRQGHLIADRRRIAANCTSFILTQNHMIFTTSQHLLKFVHLTAPESMDVPGDTPEQDERCRSIERGAQVVNVMPSAYAVVLQMPRGNLETVYPRALVLAGIRKHIDERDYRKAYVACRNHQVDMNILHDYRADQFMSSVALFVEQLRKGERIDDFLSKLKEEDVSKTLYRDTMPQPKDPNISSANAINSTAEVADKSDPLLTASSKVNQICSALLSTLDPSKYLQSIITAHVCKRPPDLEAGLNLVSDLMKSSPPEAESAISHLCFLTDPNTLYTSSLSLHNLELTLLVAQQSQRDPREYVPHLRHLHSLPPLRRAFEIDDSLGYHTKALTSLHALSVHDEAETYTLKHSLYTTALFLYKYSPHHISTFTRHYASHLASTSIPLRAAILYESLCDHNNAYPLYALAHRWRESLSSALLTSPPLPPDQLRSHAQSLITTLTEETRDFSSAATIASDHLHDIPLSATLLCRGSYFTTAIHLLALHNLSSSIPTIIDPGLTDKFADLTDLLADCRAQLAVQVPRILELRRKRAEDPLAFFGGDPSSLGGPGAETDIPDNLSLAPTDASTRTGLTGTLATRYSSASRQTSRSKRREERKKARGKKGSVYEAGYLVASVARLVERVNGVGEEVTRVVEGLWRRGMRERAGALEEGMKSLVGACEKGVEEVWGEGEDRGEVGAEDLNGEGKRPPGADGVQWDAEMGRDELTPRPVINKWEGSGIMD
ncbi:MAG: hypothetical protein Q9160_008030 [Pyrenula sp. 1 TL-2023]